MKIIYTCTGYINLLVGYLNPCLGGSCINIRLGHDVIPGLTNELNKLCFANSLSIYLYIYITNN